MLFLKSLETLSYADINHVILENILINPSNYSILDSDFFDSSYQIINEHKVGLNSSLMVCCDNEIVFYIKLKFSDDGSDDVECSIWKTCKIDYQKDLSGFTEYLLMFDVLRRYNIKLQPITNKIYNQDLWLRMLGHFSSANYKMEFVKDGSIVKIDPSYFSPHIDEKITDLNRATRFYSFYLSNYKFFDFLRVLKNE